MMLAANLVQRITQRGQEVLVRGQNLAIQAEFDHGLHLADRCYLAFEIGQDQLLLGDVGDIGHHLERLAAWIQNRVVNRSAPELAAAPSNSFVFAYGRFSATKLVPEQPIFRGGPLRRVHEHAVMLAADVIEGVAEHGQEVFVRSQDFPVQTEFDRGQHLVDRAELALVPRGFAFIGGDTEKPCDLAVVAGDRHEGDPYVDRTLVPSHMVQPGRCRFTTQQAVLHLPKHRARAFRLGQQSGIGLADDCIRCRPQQRHEVGVHIHHFTVEPDLYQRLRPIERDHASLHLSYGGPSIMASPPRSEGQVGKGRTGGR